jgi:DNA-binding SARP family transcriptional activator
MAAPVWAARAADAVESLGEAPGRSAAPLGDGGSPMRVTTLGRLAVVINDREVAPAALGGDLGRQILGALLAAGGSVHRDRLRAWLRPDAPLEDGDADLDAALAALTETLGRDRIAVDGPVSRLALRAKDSWDIAELREAAPPAGPPEEIAATLEGLRDAPFAEWPGAEWARPALDAWSAHVRHLRGALADALMREGRLDEARGELGRLAQAEPEDERWQRALMRCHAAAGDMPLALRQYHACRSTLRRMLGTDPSPETQALYLELLAGRRGGDGP